METGKRFFAHPKSDTVGSVGDDGESTDGRNFSLYFWADCVWFETLEEAQVFLISDKQFRTKHGLS